MAEQLDETRGIVLELSDLTWPDWPERLAAAGLNTLALHPWPTVDVRPLVEFVTSDDGQAFLTRCRRLGLRLEYELHALSVLLPRELFDQRRELFRMDDEGHRTPDANLCCSQPEALDLVAANAVELSRVLRPDTGRYFFWGDDGKAWCRCPHCRELSESEQALTVENHLLQVLRETDPCATVAHLAYHGTMAPPTQVGPLPGIFLEYAPIHRQYEQPFTTQPGAVGEDCLESLDANLEVFGTAGAQVLEYWLDVSRFSKWRKPAVELPWSEAVFLADVAAYRSRGIRHLTSFGAFLDAAYIEAYGEPPLAAYGRGLAAR